MSKRIKYHNRKWGFIFFRVLVFHENIQHLIKNVFEISWSFKNNSIQDLYNITPMELKAYRFLVEKKIESLVK